MASSRNKRKKNHSQKNRNMNNIPQKQNLPKQDSVKEEITEEKVVKEVEVEEAKTEAQDVDVNIQKVENKPQRRQRKSRNVVKTEPIAEQKEESKMSKVKDLNEDFTSQEAQEKAAQDYNAKKQKSESIYDIENKRAQEKLEQNMEKILEKDKKRLEQEEYEKNRDTTIAEDISSEINKAYNKKKSKLPLITGLLVGVIVAVAVISSIIVTSKKNDISAALYECETIVGHSRLDYISKGYIKHKDEILKKIESNEPRNDENISKKIERFSGICEKGLDIPENSIYYFYDIVGIGK